MVILNQQELGFEHYNILHSGYLAALAQATKRGTLKPLAQFRKDLGFGILNLVESGIKFPGYPAFCVDDKIELIKYRGFNFDEWFGGMKVVATTPYELDENELMERAVDTHIIAELGDGKCETNIAVLFWGIETGYWSKDRCYLIYAKDKVGVCRAVYWRWHGDGWDAGALRVDYSRGWFAGYHVVSRKHLVA